MLNRITNAATGIGSLGLVGMSGMAAKRIHKMQKAGLITRTEAIKGYVLTGVSGVVGVALAGVCFSEAIQSEE
jgi:hypothetical protein